MTGAINLVEFGWRRQNKIKNPKSRVEMLSDKKKIIILLRNNIIKNLHVNKLKSCLLKWVERAVGAFAWKIPNSFMRVVQIEPFPIFL